VASVVQQNEETGDWALLPHYFDEVWQAYLFKAKAYIFALREDVLSGFTPKIYYPVTNPQKQEGQRQLIERLQCFCIIKEESIDVELTLAKKSVKIGQEMIIPNFLLNQDQI